MIGILHHLISLFHEPFIQMAFLAGSLIAILSAIVGYFVVLRAQAFAAHALSHVGFAGATGAALIGISGLLGMFGFMLGSALAIALLEKKIQGRDVEIGMVLSLALGLGVLFYRLYTNSATEAVNILFGSILSVTREDIILTIVVGLGTLLALGFLFRPLLFASIDPEVAEARGVPLKLLSIVFLLLLAITVAEAVQVVGILLVFALLIAPAATAQHIVRRPATAILLSVALSLGFTWGGLLLAMVTPYPVSFYISALAAVAYLVGVNLSHVFRPHRFAEPEHPDREHVEHPHHQHAHEHHHHHH
jgi:zinc/manganese transport system permease protein